MADRKHSPDVLAELLGAELPAAAAPALQPQAPASRAAKAQPPADPRPKRPPQPALEVTPVTWETEIVTFQEHRGWRPRYVNGIEAPNWLGGPVAHDYLKQRGADGWELAGATSAARFYGVADGLQMYFRRRIQGV